MGWPDTWETGNGWSIDENHCQWCPVGASKCGAHHQSPINLQRVSKMNNECIDGHWMAYLDSSCTLKDLRAKNAFAVDRHALRIIQPIIENPDEPDTYELDCKKPGQTNRFGRIDFPKGYPDWWYLSHMDFHVPSEHTQEGKRYDGEIQMYHFYSLTGKEAGVDNEVK